MNLENERNLSGPFFWHNDCNGCAEMRTLHGIPVVESASSKLGEAVVRGAWQAMGMHLKLSERVQQMHATAGQMDLNHRFSRMEADLATEQGGGE